MERTGNLTSSRKSRMGRGLGAILAALCVAAGMVMPVPAQKEPDAPTAMVSFLVLKDDNGKPVRNAAVILHPVNTHGKQQRGGLELKTNGDGQTSFDGVPLGPMRVQVIAPGFQTYGEDFDVKTGKLDVTIRLKRPKQQYSAYDDHSADKKDEPPSNGTPPSSPPPNNEDKKPPQ
jgi:Carboxypeptidase regulatory-like domain